MENLNGASGRKRGPTKHSVEDQALDQIAKEKIVNLGRGSEKRTEEEDVSPREDSLSKDENSTSLDVSELSESQADDGLGKTRKFDSEDEDWLPEQLEKQPDKQLDSEDENWVEKNNPAGKKTKKKRKKRAKGGDKNGKSESRSESLEHSALNLDEGGIVKDAEKVVARKFDSEDEQWLSENENVGEDKTADFVMRKFEGEDEERAKDGDQNSTSEPRNESLDEEVREKSTEKVVARKFDSEDEQWLSENEKVGEDKTADYVVKKFEGEDEKHAKDGDQNGTSESRSESLDEEVREKSADKVVAQKFDSEDEQWLSENEKVGEDKTADSAAKKFEGVDDKCAEGGDQNGTSESRNESLDEEVREKSAEKVVARKFDSEDEQWLSENEKIEEETPDFVVRKFDSEDEKSAEHENIPRKFDSEDEQWPSESGLNNEEDCENEAFLVENKDAVDSDQIAAFTAPTADSNESIGANVARKFDSEDEDWLQNDHTSPEVNAFDGTKSENNEEDETSANFGKGLTSAERSAGDFSEKNSPEKDVSSKTSAERDLSPKGSAERDVSEKDISYKTSAEREFSLGRDVSPKRASERDLSENNTSLKTSAERDISEKSTPDKTSSERDISRKSSAERVLLENNTSLKTSAERDASLISPKSLQNSATEDDEWSPDTTTSKTNDTQEPTSHTSTSSSESGTSIESSHSDHDEKTSETETRDVKDELKQEHQRNFTKALQDIGSQVRRRSVLIPDQRERIVQQQERSYRMSESSTDGETAHDDGIIDFLGKENDRAEARLAARRQARVEAREIRMRELERVQKEQDQNSDKVFDHHTPARQPSMSPRERPTSTNSYHSSRRSSEDSMEDGLGLRDLRHELKEVEEKFRKAMIANAQLDNEKAAHAYQVELLKDKLEDLEEAHSLLGREHRERCREHEALKRATLKLKEELTICRMQLEERDRLIADYGLIIVGGDINEKGEVTPRELVSNQAAEVLESAGEGSLDVRLKNLAKDKNELIDEVRHLKLELEEERTQRQNEQSLTNGPLSDDVVQTLNDYRFRLQKAEQETSTLQATVARLDSQVIRYKSAAEESEKAEDELKTEKRKLLREHRESLARIEELETSNSHLQRRMDKLKNAKSTLLKEL